MNLTVAVGHFSYDLYIARQINLCYSASGSTGSFHANAINSKLSAIT